MNHVGDKSSQKIFIADIWLGSKYATAKNRRNFKQFRLFVTNNVFGMVNLVLSQLVFRLST